MYGVIDIGSNTIRLVIYKIEKSHFASDFSDGVIFFLKLVPK